MRISGNRCCVGSSCSPRAFDKISVGAQALCFVHTGRSQKRMCCLESPADDTCAAVDSPELGTFRWQLNKKNYTELPHSGRNHGIPELAQRDRVLQLRVRDERTGRIRRPPLWLVGQRTGSGALLRLETAAGVVGTPRLSQCRVPMPARECFSMPSRTARPGCAPRSGPGR
jgi:hypothetical protein